jgi:hypothetical protein
MTSFANYLFRTSCCAALLAMPATPAAAADLGGTVTYKVPSMTRPAPLLAVLVSAYNPATARKTVTRTNDVGVYLFKGLPGGLYVIFVERDGRRLYQGKVEVREPATRFDIGL